MNDSTRKWLFFIAAGGVAGLLLWGFAGLPRFGDYRGPYGYLVNSIAVSQRHVTDMATAVNFDLRGFDTLGEEYILFVSVTGVALLLRAMRGEIEDAPREFAPRSQGSAARRCDPRTGTFADGRHQSFRAVCRRACPSYAGRRLPGWGNPWHRLLLVYLAIGYRVFLRDFSQDIDGNGRVARCRGLRRDRHRHARRQRRLS